MRFWWTLPNRPRSCAAFWRARTRRRVRMPASAESHHRHFVQDVLGRSDYAIITELVQPHSKVLDLGCGDGELLQWLAQNQGVEARGIEIDGNRVQKAIARGV